MKTTVRRMLRRQRKGTALRSLFHLNQKPKEIKGSSEQEEHAQEDQLCFGWRS